MVSVDGVAFAVASPSASEGLMVGLTRILEVFWISSTSSKVVIMGGVSGEIFEAIEVCTLIVEV